MPRIVIVTALFLSLFFLVQEGFRTVKKAPPLLESAVKEKKSRSVSGAGKLSFYPAVPTPLPDLKEGYLFNEERLLEEEEEEYPAEGDDLGIRVNMDDVVYAGSLITGTIRKGLVSFLDKSKAAISKKRKSFRKLAGSSKKQQYARLVIGDVFSGYRVSAVEPKRIVFKKGDEEIVRLLNDPAKIRIKPKPLPVKKKKITKTTTPRTRKAVTAKRRRVTLSSKQSSAKKRSTPTSKAGSARRIFPVPSQGDLSEMRLE